MIYQEDRTDDIEELYSWDRGRWEDEFVQLAPGLLGFRTRFTVLPGLTITWQRFNTAMQMRSRRTAGGICFAMVVKTSEPVHYEGLQLGLHEAAYWCEGESCEVIVRPRTETLALDVDDWLVSLLGWRLPKGEARHIPAAVATGLAEACETVTQRARDSQVKGKELSSAQQGVLRTKVIEKLEAALNLWLGDEPFLRKGGAGKDKAREYYRIVEKARRAMARWDFDKPLGVGQLASRANVSERTLYRAFREWVGMAPTEFFLVHKLHLFRTRLLEGPGGHGAVSRAAMEAGFDQLGRLSGTYKRQFGETPRETLKRRGQQGRVGRGTWKGPGTERWGNGWCGPGRGGGVQERGGGGVEAEDD